jgi:eukaryotic-like serine/threonine-protein kinase
MEDVALLIPIIGMIAGTVMLGILVSPLLVWMKYRHQIAKERLQAEAAGNPETDKKMGRLVERLENLEALMCRLDTEINTQLERSLSMGRIATGADPSGVSQMPTTFMNVVSALEGRYQVLKELGRGGMGIVFQAYDKQLKEQVAIKILSPLLSNDNDALERLKREVSAARRITHSNVIRIHDIAEANGLQYVSMEYFAGSNLKEYMKQAGHLSLMEAFNIASQVCDGLRAAHEQGVIHRDLKSQNIIINAANQIKIIDFGLAHTQQMQGLTATGLIMGTPEYMAPEQVSGKRVDERADVYSLGIILYELFTGKVPFTGPSAISVGFQQMKDSPPPPTSVNPQIPVPLEQVILKALQKDPMQRHRSVAELKEDLDQAVRHPVGSVMKQSAAPQTQLERSQE